MSGGRSAGSRTTESALRRLNRGSNVTRERESELVQELDDPCQGGFGSVVSSS